MGDDQIFRIVLVVGMLIFMPIGIYHRVKSQASPEKLDRRQEGLFILFTLRPLGLAMMAGLIAFIVSPASMAWSSVPLPIWLRWTGAAIGLLAGLLLAWTFRSLGTNLTDTVVTRAKHTLITTAPTAGFGTLTPPSRLPPSPTASLQRIGLCSSRAVWPSRFLSSDAEPRKRT
jgi:hypothetical protein